MRNILQSLGDKMTEHELDEMMVAADSDQDGFINYEGLYAVLLMYYITYVRVTTFSILTL